jgi:Na+-driven multidrug efflux pump
MHIWQPWTSWITHTFSHVQVAAMGLMFSAFTFMFYFSDGYGCAASTRVSNGEKVQQQPDRYSSIPLL